MFRKWSPIKEGRMCDFTKRYGDQRQAIWSLLLFSEGILVLFLLKSPVRKKSPLEKSWYTTSQSFGALWSRGHRREQPPHILHVLLGQLHGLMRFSSSKKKLRTRSPPTFQYYNNKFTYRSFCVRREKVTLCYISLQFPFCSLFVEGVVLFWRLRFIPSFCSRYFISIITL